MWQRFLLSEIDWKTISDIKYHINAFIISHWNVNVTKKKTRKMPCNCHQCDKDFYSLKIDWKTISVIKYHINAFIISHWNFNVTKKPRKMPSNCHKCDEDFYSLKLIGKQLVTSNNISMHLLYHTGMSM